MNHPYKRMLLTLMAVLLSAAATESSSIKARTLKKGRKKGKKGGYRHVLSTCMEPYPGYDGSIGPVRGKVDVYFLGMEGMEMDFMFKLSGLESNCNDCGIHIHEGTTCSSNELVMGHYWNNGDNMTPDPWTAAFGAVYDSDDSGRARGGYFLNSGYGIDDNDGHAVVVHAQDGRRIACGVLQRGIAKCGRWRKRKKMNKGTRYF